MGETCLACDKAFVFRQISALQYPYVCFNSQSGILLDVMLSSNVSNSRDVGILCRDQFSRTLEERFCVGWNSRNARSLLVSFVEKANVSTSMTLQLNLFRVCGQRGVPKMTVSPFPQCLAHKIGHGSFCV